MKHDMLFIDICRILLEGDVQRSEVPKVLIKILDENLMDMHVLPAACKLFLTAFWRAMVQPWSITVQDW